MVTIVILVLVGIIFGIIAAHVYCSGSEAGCYVVVAINVMISCYTARLILGRIELVEIRHVWIVVIGLVLCIILTGVGWTFYRKADNVYLKTK
jgi:hypothetical protein